jgi:hypothetical protein
MVDGTVNSLKMSNGVSKVAPGQNPNVVILAAYFGPQLPEYIRLWLRSCEWNMRFNWVLITDCSIDSLHIPRNVRVIKCELGVIRGIFEDGVGFKVALDSPYKLCDFRPIYWLIFDYFNIEYDFWGHCDVDVIFGNLAKFITEDHLARYDKIFDFGHLSILRNSPIAKLAFMLDGSKLQWRDVFCNPRNVGFDEYNGVNKIWKSSKLPYLESGRVVADIDPQFKFVRLTVPHLNRRGQYFYFEDGHLYQAYKSLTGRRKRQEYAYLHFQKRKMTVSPGLENRDSFLVAHTLFAPLKDYRLTTNQSQSMVETVSVTTVDRINILRTWMRFIRRELSNAF